MSKRKPPVCGNCAHPDPHNRWGKCAAESCQCREPAFPEGHKPTAPRKSTPAAPLEGEVLVFRNPDTQRPVAVPDEVVAEAERPYRAYLLKRRGYSWHEIAQMEGWESWQAVSETVQQYLREGKAVVGELRRRELVALMIDRLEAGMNAVWPAAMEGKINAVMAMRTLVMDEVKLLALDAGEETKTAEATTVVVLDGDETDYVGHLRAVVEGPG